MSDRRSAILARLARQEQVKVADLASQLNVSQVTIRKDLDALEELGIIRRAHGYALLKETEGLQSRFALWYDEKMRIAQAACDLVHSNETFFIESGSTCALAAMNILQQKENPTLITNSVFVTNFVRRWISGRLYLLGGEYQPEAQVNVGPMITRDIEPFYADLFFISCEGYDEKAGFTGLDYMRCQSVRDIAAHAQKIILLTNSQKLEHKGNVQLLPISQIYQVITDPGIPDSIQKSLEDQGVIVTVV